MAIHAKILNGMGERIVTQIVEERCDKKTLCPVQGEAADLWVHRELHDHPLGNVKYSETVTKTRMICSSIYEVCGSELFDAIQLLEWSESDDLEQRGRQIDVPPNRVSYGLGEIVDEMFPYPITFIQDYTLVRRDGSVAREKQPSIPTMAGRCPPFDHEGKIW